MAYRLEHAESLPDGLRRIAAEQLDGAIGALRGETALPRDQAVHDARKRLKKTRAVLRLVREELGEQSYRRQNTRLRDAARRLAGARDAAVLIESLDAVLAAAPPTVGPGLAPVAELLRGRRAAAEARVFEQGDVSAEVAAELGEARQEVAAWPLGRDRFRTVAPGLRRAYGRGAERLAEARRDPDAERLHEWRKRVKDLWYHARILEPAWPAGLGPLVAQTDELGDVLGLDHDLAVLRNLLLEEAQVVEEPGVVDAAVALIDERRDRLAGAALATGRRLYAERPKAFTRRLGVYWEAWRDERA